MAPLALTGQYTSYVNKVVDAAIAVTVTYIGLGCILHQIELSQLPPDDGKVN